MKTKNVIISCLLALTLTSISCKKQAAVTATGGSGGSNVPTLGRYISTCITTSGTVYQANSYKNWLIFNGTTYSFNQLYFIDSGCTTPAFTLSSGGTYSIGAATNAPAYGYNITFTLTSSTETAYTTAVRSDLNTYCGANWSTVNPVPTTYNSTTPGLSCSALGIVSVNTSVYNAFVINGTQFSLGTFTQSNPGVTVQGSVATSTSINLNAY